MAACRRHRHSPAQTVRRRVTMVAPAAGLSYRLKFPRAVTAAMSLMEPLVETWRAGELAARAWRTLPTPWQRPRCSSGECAAYPPAQPACPLRQPPPPPRAARMKRRARTRSAMPVAPKTTRVRVGALSAGAPTPSQLRGHALTMWRRMRAQAHACAHGGVVVSRVAGMALRGTAGVAVEVGAARTWRRRAQKHRDERCRRMTPTTRRATHGQSRLSASLRLRLCRAPGPKRRRHVHC